MNLVWPYASFLLGAIFGLILQWISYRLSYRKDRRREYCIRKLNSYQDFWHQTSQLLGLLDSNVHVPENVYWQSLLYARKAAYDAAFFDISHKDRTDKMKGITVKLVKLFQAKENRQDNIKAIQEEIDKIQKDFYGEEKLLMREMAESQTL